MAREQKPSYLCPGFYPLEADNLMHAACLFAVWRARRYFGPGALCTRLVMQTEPGPDRASFEATLTKGVTSEPYRFTVLAQHDGASPDPRLPIGDCADGPVPGRSPA